MLIVSNLKNRTKIVVSQITNEIQYKTVKNFKIFIHPENVLPLIRSKQPFYAVTPYPRARYQSAIEPQIDFHEAQKQRRVMPQIMTGGGGGERPQHC